MATALKRKGSSSRVYTVVGDGECGEGSIWEAAMYAHQYKLGNLVVFVDRNGMSFDGPTEEYMARNRSQTNGARSAGTPSPSTAMT